jgi:hypothetical protein
VKKGGFDDISEELDMEPGAISLGAIRCPWEKERRCWQGDWPLKKNVVKEVQTAQRF